jgi:hypothetical protein
VSAGRKDDPADFCPQIPLSREMMRHLQLVALRRLALAYGLLLLLAALIGSLVGFYTSIFR